MMADSETASPFRDLAPFGVEAQGHHLHFYPGGHERLEALLCLIDSACETLRMAFYIYVADASGCLVRDALVAAARRGVQVQLMLDSFGSEVEADFFTSLTAAGGTFTLFMPRWDVRYLIRNHQKMVVADGQRAMLGGFNIADRYFAAPGPHSWTDIAFTVEGPVVARITQWFDLLTGWARDPHARLRGIRRLVRTWHGGDGAVRLLIGGPTRGPSSWAWQIGERLRGARQLDMMMAYFSPPPKLSRLIGQIAGTGRARLVMAGKSDNGATVGASRAFYSSLLRTGTRIWEYEAAMLHSKLIVADDWVFVGSANFDMRSLYLNMEIMLCIEDAALADRMRQFVDDHLSGSRAITPEVHQRQAGWWNGLRWWASWFLVGVVDYTVSRRLNLGL